MAKLEMNISSDMYEQKISDLSAQVSKLEGILQRYKDYEKRISTFVGEEDANFEKLRENARVNIETAQRAYTIAVQSRDALQKEFAEMTKTSREIGQKIEDAGTAAKAAIKQALPVDNLLDA